MKKRSLHNKIAFFIKDVGNTTLNEEGVRVGFLYNDKCEMTSTIYISCNTINKKFINTISENDFISYSYYGKCQIMEKAIEQILERVEWHLKYIDNEIAKKDKKIFLEGNYYKGII